MREDELDKVDFRNYAHDIHDIDCGTPSGMGQYIEWLEELICKPKEYLELVKYLTEPK